MMNLVMNGEYFYILRLRFIEPVHKIFYVLLDEDSRDNVFDINIDIQKALREKNIIALSSILQMRIDEFNEWYNVAYYEAVLRMCKEPLDFLRYMVLRSLEGRAKLGLGMSEIIRIYHSTEGIVDAYLKSIKNQLDKEEKTMSNKVSPATSMSTEYWILRVNHLQKVCYIILGDVPVFKAIKIVDEIHSYFEKNSIDIFTALFSVSFDVYQKWLQLLVSEDIIKINVGKSAVLDETQLSSLKGHVTSIKYELEIEPNAAIRSYTGDIPEIAENLFNELFNDAKTDEQKDNKTPYNPVSSALSKIRIRIQDLERLKNSRSTIECNMITHQKAIDKLTYQLNEINEDIIHTQNRINILRKEAIEEGYEEWFIDRIIKEEMGCKGNI